MVSVLATIMVQYDDSSLSCAQCVHWKQSLPPKNNDLISASSEIENELYNVTFRNNSSYAIEEGNLLICNQCQALNKSNITFTGNGTLLIKNSYLYYIKLWEDLEIKVINSTIEFTEIGGHSNALYQNVHCQQIFSEGNATIILIDSKLLANGDSPIPGSPSSGVFFQAQDYSRIISAFDKKNWSGGLWGKPRAGIICWINGLSYNETDTCYYLRGKGEHGELVKFAFYLESMSYSKVYIFLDNVLDSMISIQKWRGSYLFNTSKYENRKYTLRIVINNSHAENSIRLEVNIDDHLLTRPTILTPNGGEILSGDAKIRWEPIICSAGHFVSYTISFSRNAGLSWWIEESGISDNMYVWDTSIRVDGSNYLIKVNASCTDDAWVVDTSDGIFQIQNTPPPTITITNPGRRISSNTIIDGIPVMPSNVISGLLILGIIITVIILRKMIDRR